MGNVNMGAAFMRFTFSDDQGEIFAELRMNPADIKLAQRCLDASEYFENLREAIPENASFADVVKLNDELESKLCEILGYDARKSLFGQVSATAIMGDGRMFATHVMEAVADAIAPEIEKRRRSMAEAVSRHTAKYE